MSNLNSRLDKLEHTQGNTQPLTWREFTQLDGAAWDDMRRNDPALARAWDVFIAEQKPSEILARADELISQGTQPTEAQRAAIKSLRTVTK